MFEIFLSYCALSGADCQDVLVAGAGFESIEACESAAMEQEGNFADAEGSKLVCKERPESRLEFQEIADGIFAHEGDVAPFESGHRGDLSNTGFVIGDEAVLVIDSGGSYDLGGEIYLAVREKTDLPIVGVVLTHMHPDHIYGARFFEEIDVPVYANMLMEEAMLARIDSYEQNYVEVLGPREMVMSALPKVTEPVPDGLELDLGGRNVVMQSWPTAHTNNDLTVYDAKTRTLFAGDLLFHRHIPVIDGSIRGWQDVRQMLESLEIEHLIGGHGAVDLSFPDGFDAQMRYFDVLVEDTKTALDEGARLGDAMGSIGQSEKPNWELFDDYNARNATAVYTELEWE